MPDFLEIMETMREEAFDPTRRNQRKNTRRYQERLVEALNLIARAEKGDRFATAILQEVMTTSDFSQITGDLLNRQMVAQYQAWQPFWQQIANRRTVNDFRNVRSVIWAELAGLLPIVPEQTGYPAASLSDSAETWSVAKHGLRIPFSWELAINDDMGAFRRVPTQLAQQARRSEDYLVTTLFASTTGPLNTVYTAGNKNIINTTNGASATNPALSISGLQDGFTVLGNMVDASGNPIMISSAILMVPPSLEITAQNILNATQLIVGADSAAQRIQTNNWMRNRLQLVVNPYLPVVSTTNGNTSWYLFADPSNGRPAIDFGLLRGHEEPDIWMKAPNAVRVGGGSIDPMDGDFDTDTIQYRIRHVYGGSMIDAKMTVASNGTGA